MGLFWDGSCTAKYFFLYLSLYWNFHFSLKISLKNSSEEWPFLWYGKLCYFFDEGLNLIKFIFLLNGCFCGWRREVWSPSNSRHSPQDRLNVGRSDTTLSLHKCCLCFPVVSLLLCTSLYFVVIILIIQKYQSIGHIVKCISCSFSGFA